MPTLIPYEQVVQQLTGQGLECLYFQSGAFGFPKTVPQEAVGWIGPPDPTIRPAAQALAIQVNAPYEANLVALATRAWMELLPGPIWVQPKAHWAYELMFGSDEWMPEMLRSIAIDPATLDERHDGSALQFEMTEASAFQSTLETLLGRLFGSDFMLTFPGRPVVCTVHHHKQLWWITTDPTLAARLRELVPKAPDGNDSSV